MSRARSSISTRPSARSCRRAGELILLASLFGCGLAKSGTATVSAEFDELECQRDKRQDGLEDYAFDAAYMSTERFSGVLLIMIQKHRVNLEETDSLVLRVLLEDLMEQGDLVVAGERIVRPDTTKALSLSLSPDREATNASLSLFQTCPEFPTHHALSGELSFTAFELAEDPDDTGRMEHLAGTLTATLTRSNADGRVGALRAAFDFAPPRRPLTDFE